MTADLLTDDSIDLATAEREPYREPKLQPGPKVPHDKVVIPGGKGRKRYYDPWPEPPEEYVWSATELEDNRRAALRNRPGKTRTGGFHADVRDGEVGPCSRCGWVWYPTMKSLLRSDFPHRCTNCRTPDWRVPPVYQERDEAYHYAKHRDRHVPYERCKICHPARPGAEKWIARRKRQLEATRRRKAERLALLAEELGKQIVDQQPLQSSPAPYMHLEVGSPAMRPRHVIPPPPSFEEESK